MHPIDTLKHEHRFIEKVLTALEAYAARAGKGEAVPREDLAGFAEFIRAFADTCHHGKEEDILFKELSAYGMPADSGPIAVMLHEHEIGRQYALRLAELGAGEGPLGTDEAADLVRAARGYTSLLRDHIAKEDNILYPMAMNLLPPDVLEAMAQQFEDFEANEMGEGTHARFHARAETLITRYAA